MYPWIDASVGGTAGFTVNVGDGDAVMVGVGDGV